MLASLRLDRARTVSCVDALSQAPSVCQGIFESSSPQIHSDPISVFIGFGLFGTR